MNRTCVPGEAARVDPLLHRQPYPLPCNVTAQLPSSWTPTWVNRPSFRHQLLTHSTPPSPLQVPSPHPLPPECPHPALLLTPLTEPLGIPIIFLKWGNSLAVQWLALCALIAEGPGSIPGQGTKIPQASWCGQKK